MFMISYLLLDLLLTYLSVSVVKLLINWVSWYLLNATEETSLSQVR